MLILTALVFGKSYFLTLILEEITGIDLVAAQIQIAAGASLEQLSITQDKVKRRGYAIQCRITTEDPANNFQPDTGKILVYRSVGGMGVRLDGGAGYSGAIITPHYDSLLVKVSCSGSNFEVARRKVIRVLVEFRVRGVKTNIQFLQRLVSDPNFIKGNIWTTFIDDTPELFIHSSSKNRAQKILNYLGTLAVNGSQVPGQMVRVCRSFYCLVGYLVTCFFGYKQGEPGYLLPISIPALPLDANGQEIDTLVPCTDKGWRKLLLEYGPKEFAKQVRQHKGLLVMDTTWRDAHQSLIATRLRTVGKRIW